MKEKIIHQRAVYQIDYSAINDYYGTVQEWFEYWLSHQVGPTVKQSTYASYQHKLQTYVFPYMGTVKLVKLTQETIQEWIDECEQRLSASSLKVIFRVFQSGMEAARKKQFRRDNPCEGCELPKVPTRQTKALSQLQQKKLVEAAMDSKNGFPIMLALDTGMRIGEICGLKWEDINFEEGYLSVQRTRQRIIRKEGKGTFLAENSPKTAHSQRVIPLSAKLVKLLKKRHKESSSVYVIESEGDPLEPRSIDRHFKNLINQFGWSGISFHSLRHTFATRCVELGVNIAAISSLMGHSSIKTTLDIYTTTFFSEKRAAIQQVTLF